MQSIPLFKVYMNPDVDKPLSKVLHSGWIGQGEKVKEFESALSDMARNPYCLALSCGTHGLHLALHLLGVGEGDEVITTALTCTATNWPILMTGAKIVWADIDPQDLNISPSSIKQQITSRTKAIMVTHWGGYPCDMLAIKEVANGIPVIEDAAHAVGSQYGVFPTGSCSYSDFTMFSFQAIKHLTCGDGGALFCSRKSDYDRGKLLRWYGIDREGPRKDMRCEEDIPEWGYKYHMNDINATIGLSNLEHLNWMLDRHRSNARFYNSELANFPGITLIQQSPERLSSYWIYTMLVSDRLGFSRLMGEKGIMISRVHERNDKHTCVYRFRKELPHLDSVIGKMICIPVGWWVGNEEREYIVSSIKEGW